MSKSTEKVFQFMLDKQKYFGIKKWFYYQVDRIADQLSINRRTVIRQLNILEEANVIGVSRSPNRKNYYHVNVTAMVTKNVTAKNILLLRNNITSNKFLSSSSSSKKKNSRNAAGSGKHRKLRRSTKLRKKLKQTTTVDNSRWIDYIFDHWCSKGKPLTAHQRGTGLYERIVNQIKKALKLHNRKDICARIDTYFWLLTTTDLKARVPFKPAGLVVNLAEFFCFTAETKGRPGFTFNDIDSWFDECGKPRKELMGKYYRGSAKMAEQIGKKILQYTGIRPTMPKMMKVSVEYLRIIKKYNVNPRTDPMHHLVRIIQRAEFEDMKFIGKREYKAFEEVVRTKLTIKPKPELVMRKLVRSNSEAHTPKRRRQWESAPKGLSAEG